MTSEQLEQLENARAKDFILVENPHREWRLLYICFFDTNPLHGLRWHVKRLYNPQRKDVFHYQQYGTWWFEIQPWGTESLPLSVLIDREDTITVKPSVEKLRGLLGGSCLYDGCNDGLVKTDWYTQVAVPWRRSTERVMARTAGVDAFTICPFCMGWELFERHEFLANLWTADRYPPYVSRAHMQTINAQRAQMGYDWLVPGTKISTLTHGTPQALVGNPAGGGIGQGAMGTARNVLARISALSTHLFGWFKNAKERVLDDGCAICRESFQDGEKIADLPCEHFYHERCVRQHFSYLGASPTCPLCQHAVAL